MRRRATQKFTFSQKAIAKVLPQAAGRVAYRDLQMPDLGLRVDANGRKAFFWWRQVNGRPVYKTLGGFPTTSIAEARDKAHELSADLDRLKRNDWQGPNPFEGRREEPTLGELLEDYISRHLRQHAKKPPEAEQSARWIFRHLHGWSGRKLSQVRRRNVLDLQQSIGENHGQTMSNRVLQLLKAMFNFAERTELWSGPNPAAKIRLYHENERTRFLQPDELPRFFQALKREPSRDLRDFTFLCLWTGARKSDVFSMRWEDVRLPDNRWDVPDPKNREPYPVPLTPEAAKVLHERLLLRRDGNPWVFPSFGRTGHLTGLKKRWRALLKRARVDDLHVHDLRRTLGSWEAAQGSSLLVIGKSLGHRSTAATQVYARLNLDAVRASVQAATQAIVLAAKKKPKLLKEASDE